MTVIGRDEEYKKTADAKQGHHRIYWKCSCVCGGNITVDTSALTSGRVTSCGCIAPHRGLKPYDITGQKFGRLTAIEPTDKRSFGSVVWKCKCSCGATVYAPVKALKSGNIKSCGCLHRDITIKRNKEGRKYCQYRIDGDVVYGLTINTNKEFKFDLDLFDKVKNVGWYEDSHGRISGFIDGETTELHRFVLDLHRGDGKEVDHINQDPADCRVCNLRFCTHQQNLYNQRPHRGNKLGVKGVQQLENGKFRARIGYNNKTYYIGTYDTLEEARNARIEIEKIIAGEFAYDDLNKEEYHNDEQLCNLSSSQ